MPRRRCANILTLAGVLTLFVAGNVGAQTTTGTNPDLKSLAWGRQYTNWFYDGQADSLRAHFGPAMTGALSEEALLKFRDQIAVQAGTEGDVIKEEVVQKDSVLTYERDVHFSNAGETVIMVTWSIGPDRKILGFYVKPKPS
ncbi:MAG: hypothetical protein ABJD11_04315 [Gemmatimonadota bacterium]